jgi:hypothetical protein
VIHEVLAPIDVRQRKRKLKESRKKFGTIHRKPR